MPKGASTYHDILHHEQKDRRLSGLYGLAAIRHPEKLGRED